MNNDFFVIMTAQAMSKDLNKLIIVIKSAGEMASAIAHRLWSSGFHDICLTEIDKPLAVHRGTTFSEAVFDGMKTVEGLTARLIDSPGKISEVWKNGEIPLMVDPGASVINFLHPGVVVDAIMAKKNLGTGLTDADLVIGIGPGFEAGKDVHLVVETFHNENLGKVIKRGRAEPDNAIPLDIGGYTFERAIHAPASGKFREIKHLGEMVVAGEDLVAVDDNIVKAEIGGVLRATLRDGLDVDKGVKIAEIDPVGGVEVCYTIRAKMRAVAGGVLEAVLMTFNK
jgi:xanthine dehydrogenase accessory factor